MRIAGLFRTSPSKLRFPAPRLPGQFLLQGGRVARSLGGNEVWGIQPRIEPTDYAEPNEKENRVTVIQSKVLLP
jgi:hypothetical protein